MKSDTINAIPAVNSMPINEPSELNNIKGIGGSTIKELMKEFRSVKNIKGANAEELIKIVGKSKANIILTYFHAGREINP